jgi:hypothetical protein
MNLSDVKDVYASGNEATKLKQQEKRSERRFGHAVRFDSYECGNTIRMIAVVIAIMVIPLQLFFMGVMKSIEDEFIIVPLQESLPEECKSGICNQIIAIPLYLFNGSTTVFLCIGYYLCGDSLLAFKGAFLLCSGFFMLTALTMLIKDGRPFWNNDVVVPFGHCLFDFASPSDTTFVSTFFWLYMLINVRFKYTSNPNKCLNALLVFAIIILNVWSFFNGAANGVNYIYQSLIGVFSAFVYLVLCMTFDKEIHRWCEKTGFILHSSRVKKFETFFACVAALSVVMVYYMFVYRAWDMPQNWVINAIFNDSICEEQFNL